MDSVKEKQRLEDAYDTIVQLIEDRANAQEQLMSNTAWAMADHRWKASSDFNNERYKESKNSIIHYADVIRSTNEKINALLSASSDVTTLYNATEGVIDTAELLSLLGLD